MARFEHVYVALLRAVNVGGRRSVSMGDLRALFEALPAEEVASYVQSGNVVFRSAVGDAAEVAAAAEERMASQLGLKTVVIVRSAAEMGDVVARNPFLSGAGPSRLHVTFLATAPDGAAPPVAGPDQFAVRDRAVYLWCPDGYGRSKLNNAFFEKNLAVAATTRNWRTVTTLAGMAAELAGAEREFDRREA